MTGGGRLGAPVPILALEEHIESIDVAPDGRRVAAASVSGEVAVAPLPLEGSAGSVPPSSVRTIRRHAAEAVRVRWSPDGQHLATAGNDGVVAIHGEDGTPRGAVESRGWCGDLAWRPDGTEVAVAFGRSVLRVGVDGVLWRTLGPHPVAVTGLAWWEEGDELAAAVGADVWWYADADAPVRTSQGSGAALALAVSPGGRWLAVGNQDASIHCWQLIGEPDELAMAGFATKVSQLSWSSDAALLAAGNLGRVSVWDFTGLGPKGADPRQLVAHEGRTTALAFAPGATAERPLLASGGADGMVRLLVADGAHPQPLAEVEAPGSPTTLRWVPSGDAVVVGCSDGSVVAIPVQLA